MAKIRTHYDNLKVARNAPDSIIRAAYKTLMQQYHPDKFEGDPAEAERISKIIQNSFSVLIDPIKRSQHDKWIEEQELTERAEKKQNDSSTFSGESKNTNDSKARENPKDDESKKSSSSHECPDFRDKWTEKQQQPKTDNNRSATSTEDLVTSPAWESVKPYFVAALVSPDFSGAEKESFKITKAVRYTLFAALSAIFFSLLSLDQNRDKDIYLGNLILSILSGWGLMFIILDIFPAHRKYLQQERLDNYLPIFQQLFHDKNNWQSLPNSIWFPPPWFGYYGIIWPLVAVAAVFFTVDFLILINVNENIFNNEFLISIYEITSKPLVYMCVWAGLGYSFNSMLYTVTKERLEPFIKAKNLDEVTIHRALRPKAWKGGLATVAFFVATSAPGWLIFPAEKEQIDAILAARKKSPQESYNIGYKFSAGKNYPLAIKWYQVAADLGYAPAINNIGVMYESGNGVQQNYAEAFRLYQLAAKQGYSSGQYNLGRMYLNGDTVLQNYAEAFRLFQLAAVQKYSPAQHQLGLMFQLGIGIQQNYSEALRWYQLAASQGQPESMRELGLMYKRGNGIAQDSLQALSWLSKAADQGDAIAQYGLCHAYSEGLGVQRNFEAAIELCTVAAKQNHAQAYVSLGWFYMFDDYGVKHDYQKAFELNKKAYDLGAGEGATNLGIMYQQGMGINVDLVEAANWYKKAINLEDHSLQAEFMLAELLFHGKGIARDTSTARILYQKIVNSGVTWGISKEDVEIAKNRLKVI